jgi:MFS transporter, DHA2 family, multidrug resistance protein
LQLHTGKATNKLLISSLNGQTHIRFAMDYYEIMSWLLVATLLMIALFPRLNKTVAYLKSRRLSPS